MTLFQVFSFFPLTWHLISTFLPWYLPYYLRACEKLWLTMLKAKGLKNRRNWEFRLVHLPDPISCTYVTPSGVFHSLFYTNSSYSIGVFLFKHLCKEKLFPDRHHQWECACVAVHLIVWTELLWWMLVTRVYDRQTQYWSAAYSPASLEWPHRDSGDNKMNFTSSSPLFEENSKL